MNYYEGKKGWVEVICGPMFAGKTEELIRRVRRMDYAKKKYLVFKPSIDNRYSETEVVSHNKKAVKAINVNKCHEIEKYLSDEIQAIVIDEAQFFDDALIEYVRELAGRGYRVICAGLDTDFRGEPFGLMGPLMALAEQVTKLTAICTCCGNEATKTQRIINGKPAYYDDPIILVGEKESYEARCRDCHIVLFRDEK